MKKQIAVTKIEYPARDLMECDWLDALVLADACSDKCGEDSYLCAGYERCVAKSPGELPGAEIFMLIAQKQARIVNALIEKNQVLSVSNAPWVAPDSKALAIKAQRAFNANGAVAEVQCFPSERLKAAQMKWAGKMLEGIKNHWMSSGENALSKEE